MRHRRGPSRGLVNDAARRPVGGGNHGKMVDARSPRGGLVDRGTVGARPISPLHAAAANAGAGAFRAYHSRPRPAVDGATRAGRRYVSAGQLSKFFYRL